jgi:hypothetical protein
VWCHTPILQLLRRQRQEDLEFRILFKKKQPKTKTKQKARGMAQVVEHLPNMSKTPGSFPIAAKIQRYSHTPNLGSISEEGKMESGHL